MPSFALIKVIITDQHGWLIQWRVEGISPSDEVEIERSSGPEGPWTSIAVVPATDFFYADSDAAYRGLFDIYFYRLKVKNGANTLQESRAVSTSMYANRHIQKVIREYEKILYSVNTADNKMSRSLACFKRAIKGEICTDCTHPDTGQRFVDRCSTCKGTGYVEGWSNPALFKARFIGGHQKMTPVGQMYAEEESIQRTAWTGPYPILEPGDVLVERDNNAHWRVNTISVSAPDNIIISQNFTLDHVDREHIEFSLEYPN